jgi:hypothetical protein
MGRKHVWKSTCDTGYDDAVGKCFPGARCRYFNYQKPTRREYLLKQSAKRRIDDPKVKFNPFRNFGFSSPNSLQGSPNKPQKDELEMFVDSINRMATGFHRLEFRLTKAIKMIDKFVTAV